MKCMGSKARIAKHILPIILKDRKEGQCYVEPFVGGANMIDKVDGWRIGADSNKYLISLLNEMQKPGYKSPYVDSDEFLRVKKDCSSYPDWYVGFVGFQLSFGAMWFGSYRRDNQGVRDYADEALRNVDKQSKKISGIHFIHVKYSELKIPSKSIIYCDPPYFNTASYKAVGEFDHDQFWQWCRDRVNEGHQVFVSEYSAPDDFICVWQKVIQSGLNTSTTKKGIEKLFIHKSQVKHEAKQASQTESDILL